MQHPTRTRLLALPSYRARILTGPWDMAAPDANTEIIGLHAASHAHACMALAWLTDKPIIEVWRQEKQPGQFIGNVEPVDQAGADWLFEEQIAMALLLQEAQ